MIEKRTYGPFRAKTGRLAAGLYKGEKSMDGKNHTVLIADDEPEIRQVLRIFLEGERYRVLEAADGEEAVAQAGQADLILLDVMMPG